MVILLGWRLSSTNRVWHFLPRLPGATRRPPPSSTVIKARIVARAHASGPPDDESRSDADGRELSIEGFKQFPVLAGRLRHAYDRTSVSFPVRRRGPTSWMKRISAHGNCISKPGRSAERRPDTDRQPSEQYVEHQRDEQHVPGCILRDR